MSNLTSTVINNLSKLDFDTLNNDTKNLIESAISIATVNDNDKTAIASNTFDLLNNTTTMINTVVTGLQPNNEIAPKILDLFHSIFNSAKDIIDLTSSSPEDVAKVSINLVEKANVILHQVLTLTKVDNHTTQSFHKSVNESLDKLKEIAVNISNANSDDNKSQIAKDSFDLLKQVSLITSQTLQNSNLSIDKETIVAIHKISSSVFDTAGTVAELVVANDKSDIAGLSISLLNNTNSIITGTLSITAKNTELVNNIHKIVHESIDNTHDAAINLANADTHTNAGKISIAVNSLSLISQSNQLIANILNEVKLDSKESKFAQSLLDTFLNVSKNITSLVNIDANTVEGRQQIAYASTGLIEQTNELLKSVTSFSNIENSVSKATYEVIKESISKIKGVAIELAKNDTNTSKGKAEIAIQSFNLISEANNMVDSFLEKVNLNNETSKTAHKLTSSVLDTAKILTNLIQVDHTSADGKLAIVNSSFQLAKNTNDVISNIIEISGHSSPLSNKITDLVGKSLSVSQNNLLTIGKDIISLVDANALSKEGTKIIVDKSLSITKEVNEAISNIATTITGHETSNSTKLVSNVLDIGRSVANLIQTDINTTKGQAAVAEGSIKLVGSVNNLVGDILSVADMATPISKVVTSSVGGILGDVSNLVSSAVLLKDWSKMSHSEQVAAGFDIGLKSVSTIATGMIVVGESITNILGKVTMLPQVGAALSGLAVAASPLEIKGLVDQHNHVKEVNTLGIESKKFGYEGDVLLSSLLQEKFALDTAYTATNIALNVATTAISTAATASVVGAPIAAIAGVVRGVIGGILSAVKQPSLELIANRYTEQIKEYGNVQEFFKLNTTATLNKFYSQSETQEFFKELQKTYNVDSIVTLDGVSTSSTAIELAATTKLTEQINKANNYASLVRDGQVDKNDSTQYLSMDSKSGVLNINTKGNSLIKFNTPLFTPGKEEATRKEVGKNNFYTDLIINGPDKHTINDNDGSNIFISNDRYASVLYDKSGNIIKNVSLHINAGGGDDTYIADSGVTKFNGGSGIDSVSYNNEHIRGIVVHGKSAGQFIVIKNIENASVAVENIRTKQVQYGKRSEKVEYREISIENKTFERSDILHDVEIISASDYDDNIYGTDADDRFLGQKGNDLIYGRSGNDIIDGGEGNDILYGEKGNDKLTGGLGKDKVYAGDGDDLVIQDDSFSSDILDGGSGIDTLDLSLLVTNAIGKGVVFDLRSGILEKGTISDSVSGFENIVGTSGDDIIYGDKLDNVLISGSGNDTLYGNGGNDLLAGTAGNNYLYGGEGNDVYLLSVNANNHISDTHGKNMAKLLVDEKRVNILFEQESSSDTVVLKFSNNMGDSLGKTTIEHANEFGFFSIGDNYYLDLNNGSMKYVLSGEHDNANLKQNSLTINEGQELNIYATAKQNDITLSSSHHNIVSIYGGTKTSIEGFEQGKDKVKLLLNDFITNDNSTLQFSGYDKNGSDIHIKYNNTELTLYGAGSEANENKTFLELVETYIL